MIMVNVDLHEESCVNCGMTFWLTMKHYNLLQNDKSSFHCPAGHGQHYVGKSDAVLLKELQVQRKQDLFEKDKEISRLNADIRSLQRKCRKPREKKS
jgi:hypothetical protein